MQKTMKLWPGQETGPQLGLPTAGAVTRDTEL